jgi:hypothetical protein
MKTEISSLRAVLTGDVVGSSRLPAPFRRDLPAMLKKCGQDVQKAFPRRVPFELSVFRGDSWQMIVSDPAAALRAALFMRLGVIEAGPPGMRLDTRVAVAIEKIDFVPAGYVAEGDGPAYRASGAALDGLSDQSRMILVTPNPDPAASVAIQLMDAIIQDWTPAQARAVKGRLRGLIQADIAKTWPQGITQQAVARHLMRAHWPAVERALLWIDNSLCAL